MIWDLVQGVFAEKMNQNRFLQSAKSELEQGSEANDRAIPVKRIDDHCLKYKLA
jgi:hypothetical protein